MLGELTKMSIPYSLLQSCSQWYEYNPSVSEVEKAIGLFYMHHCEELNWGTKNDILLMYRSIDMKIDEQVKFF